MCQTLCDALIQRSDVLGVMLSVSISKSREISDEIVQELRDIVGKSQFEWDEHYGLGHRRIK
jgi:hypothetical protein